MWDTLSYLELYEQNPLVYVIVWIFVYSSRHSVIPFSVFWFSPTCIPFQHGLPQSLWDWGHFYVQKVEFFNDAHLQFPKIDLKQV